MNTAKPLGIKITIEQLRHLAPLAPRSVDAYLPYLNQYMPQYGIDTPKRIQYFLANCAHETGSFKYSREIWGPTNQQLRYERDMNAEWSAESPQNSLAFMLGNSISGEGKMYLGRGWIMTTGKANYKALSLALGEDFVKFPELLSVPKYSVQSACYYWQKHNLNKFADAGDFEGCVKGINGALTGIESRKEFYQKAKEVIK